MVSGRNTGSPLSYGATIMDTVVLIARVNLPIIIHLDVPVYLGSSPKDPTEWSMRDGSGGCVRKRLLISSVCDHGEGFVKVEKVVLPDTSAAAWVDMGRSRADCEVECKRNCSCSAYAVIVIPGKGDG